MADGRDEVRLVALATMDAGIGGVAFLGAGGIGDNLVVLVFTAGVDRRHLDHQVEVHLNVSIGTHRNTGGVGTVSAGHL